MNRIMHLYAGAFAGAGGRQWFWAFLAQPGEAGDPAGRDWVRGMTACDAFFTTRTVGHSFDDTVTHQRHPDRVAGQTAARRESGCARGAAMRFAIAISPVRLRM